VRHRAAVQLVAAKAEDIRLEVLGEAQERAHCGGVIGRPYNTLPANDGGLFTGVYVESPEETLRSRHATLLSLRRLDRDEFPLGFVVL
jgi:hypothetical protein